MRKSPIKWTRESAINEGKKYKTRNEFYHNSRSAYEYCLKNNFLDEIFGKSLKKCRNFWTYDKCIAEAKKCSTKKEFKEKHKSAYIYAVKEKILSDFTFLNCNKQNKYTFDYCKQLASKCRNRTDFNRKYYAAYDYSNKNQWIDSFFPSSIKLTFEKCKEIASKYNSLTDFRKNKYNVYQYMQRNNIIHILFPKKPKWDYKETFELAKKYSSKSEFRNKSPYAYRIACKNQWIDNYTWFHTPLLKERDNNTINYIYVYKDNINKVCYVGRTINLKHRHTEHRNQRYRKNSKGEKIYYYDKIKIYFDSINKPLPFPDILEVVPTYSESQIKEKYWVDFFKTNGWNVLNCAKTGINSSSLGGTYIKWTYENCFNEAKKYKTRNEFRKGSESAYSASRRNKWLSNYIWLNKKAEI